ncbi:hypothetical protein HELRODRAFT_165537 [Helobdella robusta]|uniref:Uncharacterized protein n=1 Tax=Helobdella robusta TaxID=6412 RepID=T1EWZ5_HELRO|nr:hypothetical protein HELRODRAFT_165537 [Helobdella robusta]ESN91495.1 hypothetical protein HELRODRAFT_165537 [Helobdella robusta]
MSPEMLQSKAQLTTTVKSNGKAYRWKEVVCGHLPSQLSLTVDVLNSSRFIACYRCKRVRGEYDFPGFVFDNHIFGSLPGVECISMDLPLDMGWLKNSRKALRLPKNVTPYPWYKNAVAVSFTALMVVVV